MTTEYNYNCEASTLVLVGMFEKFWRVGLARARCSDRYGL